MSTKVHLAVDGLGRPLRLLLTGGQVNDCTQAEALLAGLPAGCVIADKGYDVERLVLGLEARGVTVCIPPRSNSPQRPWSKTLYRERNVVERAIARLKQYRRIATRYDKTVRSYEAFTHLAACALWLN